VQAVRWEPSQSPPQGEPSSTHAGRAPAGAPLVGVHVPTEPGTLHASHWPEQATSQQTPSTQYPLAHWPLAAQRAPAASVGAHTPPAQNVPAGQSAFTVQVPAQAVPPLSHRYGAQGWVCGAGQWPAPSHPAARVATPPVQLAARQETVSSG
jgi:hypothetical protein